MNKLIPNLEIAINWVDITTKNGRTQKAEYNYIHVIGDQMKKLGAILGPQRGSQLHIDFKDVQWPDGNTYSFECKKVNKGTKFMFNDTVPIQDVYYIFIYVEFKRIIIRKGSTILQNNVIRVSQISLRKEFSNTVGKYVLDMIENDDFTSDSIKDFFRLSMNFVGTCVSHGILSYFDFGQLFKNTYKFGNFTSRARPNWSLNIPYN
jgi:hypothetical protein